MTAQVAAVSCPVARRPEQLGAPRVHPASRPSSAMPTAKCGGAHRADGMDDDGPMPDGEQVEPLIAPGTIAPRRDRQPWA